MLLYNYIYIADSRLAYFYQTGRTRNQYLIHYYLYAAVLPFGSSFFSYIDF